MTSHVGGQITASNTIHGIRQGHGGGLDADKLDGAHKDTDTSLGGNSDNSIPTERAIRSYIANALTSFLSTNKGGQQKVLGQTHFDGLVLNGQFGLLRFKDKTKHSSNDIGAMIGRFGYPGLASHVGYMTGNATNFGQDAAGIHISGFSEEGYGLYMSGDTTVMWNPGDYGALRWLDEDAQNTGWVIGINGSITMVSDRRKKKNIHIFNPNVNLEALKDLEFKSFVLEDHKERLKEHKELLRSKDKKDRSEVEMKRFKRLVRKQIRHGYIAQELQDVIPESVTEDDMGFLSIDHNQLLYGVIQICREQQKEISRMTAELQELRGLVNELKEQILAKN